MRFVLAKNHKIFKEEVNKNPYIPINFDRLFHEIDLANKKVLILGANRGYEAMLFIKLRVKEVVGIDIFTPSEQFEHRKYKFTLASAEQLPFNDNYFDFVYSQAVLEHVSDLHKTMQEVKRVLKVGGQSRQIASPLWLTRYGHHLEAELKDFPWIHVGKSNSEILNWIESKPEIHKNDRNLLAKFEEAFNGISINQFSPSVYENAISNLSGIKVIANSFDIDNVDKSFFLENRPKTLPDGVNEIDLLKFTHLGIFQKISY